MSAHAELPIAAEENRPVDWADVTGWGIIEGHAIPVDVARFIAEKINLYSEHIAALRAPVWNLDMDAAPRDGTEVIYRRRDGSRWIGNEPPGCARGCWKFDGLRWTGSSCGSIDTAWMPLPPPPAEEDEK